MTLGARIGRYRRRMGLTQEALAKQLEVTNQAVSKWESDQCCPDISLLPKLADLFGITMDELFGREAPAQPVQEETPVEIPVEEELPEPEFWEEPTREDPWQKSRSLFEQLFHTTMEKVNQAAEKATQELKKTPVTVFAGERGREIAIPEEVIPDWEDDDTLRVVIFQGRRMIEAHPARKRIQFCWEGPAVNVHCECNLSCEEIRGNASAAGDLSCDGVGGNATAGGDLSCDNVNGSVHAIGDVSCDSVRGDVKAGGDVSCDSVGGSVTAGGDVDCEDVGGSVRAGGSVEMG